MMQPKFTVIIPTRERSDVLKASLKTVLAQSYEQLEIIVSDNFSCDDTESVVASFADDRIRYINTGKRVSMSHNWEFALSHVSEGWITIIGDDDGLLPGCLNKISELIRLTDAQAIRSVTCFYTWPDLVGTNFGRLCVPLTSGWEKRSCKEWLAKVMMGKRSYIELPMLYNGGFVDFEILKQLKEITGKFYCSMTPDVYMGIAIASIIPSYIYFFEPVAINGASRHSGGTSAFSKKKKSANSPSEKFFREPNIPFHNALPLDKHKRPIVSIQAIVYEAYLQSKCLRQSSEFEDHEIQLVLILACAGKHKESVTEWGQVFADKHGLDMEKASSKAKYIELRFKIFNWKNRIIDVFFNRRLIGGDITCSLKDVYEASIAAGTIYSISPNKIDNLLGFVATRLGAKKIMRKP